MVGYPFVHISFVIAINFTIIVHLCYQLMSGIFIFRAGLLSIYSPDLWNDINSHCEVEGLIWITNFRFANDIK